MKTITFPSTEMKPTGAGPAIIARTSPFILAAIILEVFFSKEAELPYMNDPLIRKAGLLWLLAGIVQFVTSIIQFSINFPKKRLITRGMYACSRNPIYASWILFILPALAVYLNNMMFLISALAMSLITVKLVRSEEKLLLEYFGEAYSIYRRRVKCIFGFTLVGPIASKYEEST